MRQIALKILILGDGGVGKTTLLHRYVKGEFIDTTTMTIGVEFLTKEIEVASKVCQLILWDITGQERFRHMIDHYLKGASGALILYDITSLKSFINIEKWIHLIKKFYERIPIVLIAAKCDLQEFSNVNDIMAKNSQKRFGFIDFVKTSSKTGLNVDHAFKVLTKQILKEKKF